MKTCSHCKESKEENEFAKKKNGYQSRCRPCHSLLTRRHYQENKQYYIDKARKRNDRQLEILRQICNKAKSAPCADCKVTYPPYVMDFDHLRDKQFTIAEKIATGLRVKVLEEEIAKCEVVCSNCHRIRTHQRRNAPTDG